MKVGVELNFAVSDQKEFSDFAGEVQFRIKELLQSGKAFEYSLGGGKGGKIVDQGSYEQARKLKVDAVKLLIPCEEHKDSGLSEFELLDNADAIEDSPEEKKEDAKENSPAADPKAEGVPDSSPKLDSCFLCTTGKPKKDCEICKGTGRLRRELQEHVEKLVKQGIMEYNEMRRKQFKLEDNQVLKSQVIVNFANAGKSKTVHVGTKCSACGVTPITGARYCCTVCHNTNFCEGCETIISHNHPVMKYRTVVSTETSPKTEETGPKFCAKCVSSTLKENQLVQPGEIIAVKWNLLNTGECSWPKETIIALDEESETKVKLQAKAVGEVAPNKAATSVTKITAPKTQGKCVVFLQLRDGKTGKRFGQKFWADFNVQVKEQAKDLEYTENMLKLAQMYESTDPELIIKLLKENKNNAELVANLLISQAH
eukprot:TRINITY_DN2524_c0_g4_i2.p1 TRINITY_DN2524_c0_g4~~TRINITY_DN2524_c0_g4_i2.p1  ORF type:complete len:427 (-),score=123.48 TRINITY_DN2524_c0_g4_i2:113-1393(-)